jgi:hypothetical protein
MCKRVKGREEAEEWEQICRESEKRKYRTGMETCVWERE